MNNEFLRQYKRIAKAHSGDIYRMLPDLNDTLVRLLSPMPEEMALELADYFLKEEDFEERIQRCADLVDLYGEDIDINESVLSRDDWLFIKELVNSYGGELDMDWVAYFMQFVIDMDIL